MEMSSNPSSVIQDLLLALQDDEMTDITLLGHDHDNDNGGVGSNSGVPANRFVLAARSRVLKRMLYGSFREANRNTGTEIVFPDYDSLTLEAIVEYCCRNEISKFRLRLRRNAESCRRLVWLFKAADYLELTNLANMVAQMAHNLMSRFPSLACAVYDEADLFTVVSQDALSMIQCRPYVTLPSHNHDETGGGVANLSAERLLAIFQDRQVHAGELFLFQMLKQWCELTSHPQPQQVAQACAKHISLDYIEPEDLLGVVKDSHFCSETDITNAITKQALRASKHGLWSLSSRGRPTDERILVEGAGSEDANGIYYKIDGLANGELYSKREVSCGQQYVYTLSCSFHESKERYECRIFCSKLLTHLGVQTIMVQRRQRQRGRQPQQQQQTAMTQPLLQVIQVERVLEKEDNNKSSTSSSSIRMLLSDGDHYISATMAPGLVASNRSKEILQNTLIKVLDYEKHITDGRVSLELHKVALISQDPGHRFGNPFDYYDVFDEHDGNDDDDDGDADEEELITTLEGEAIETEVVCQQALMHQQQQQGNNGNNNSNNNDDSGIDTSQQNLLKLYSCHYPVSAKPIDSKIQRTGWTVDSHGYAPSPKCRWMPGSAPAAGQKTKPNNGPHVSSSKPKREPSPTSISTTTAE